VAYIEKYLGDDHSDNSNVSKFIKEVRPHWKQRSKQ
jgi:Cft2 family RNA processing exonuclease